jgi:pimeloyl-ACP methyl ester carboxylesterase
VVSLAGIPDLRSGIESGVCGDAIPRLLGDPKERDARLREASPVELLPLGVAQRLVYADRDAIVPLDLGRAHEASARRAGDPVVLEVVEGAGHFELVNPSSRAFPAVRRAIAALLPLPFPGGRR